MKKKKKKNAMKENNRNCRPGQGSDLLDPLLSSIRGTAVCALDQGILSVAFCWASYWEDSHLCSLCIFAVDDENDHDRESNLLLIPSPFFRIGWTGHHIYHKIL